MKISYIWFSPGIIFSREQGVIKREEDAISREPSAAKYELNPSNWNHEQDVFNRKYRNLRQQESESLISAIRKTATQG